MIIQRIPQSMVACALFFSLISIVACGAGGDAGSDRSMASLSLSLSPGLYDSDGNILQPAEDRGVDTGLTADYRETISKIGLSEKDVSYKTDRTFFFEDVNGTKCELVLTRQGEGLETQYIAALQLADGSGFGLNAAAMKSKAQFEQALTNSGC